MRALNRHFFALELYMTAIIRELVRHYGGTVQVTHIIAEVSTKFMLLSTNFNFALFFVHFDQYFETAIMSLIHVRLIPELLLLGNSVVVGWAAK
jgi:hypothetical protein